MGSLIRAVRYRENSDIAPKGDSGAALVTKRHHVASPVLWYCRARGGLVADSAGKDDNTTAAGRFESWTLNQHTRTAYAVALVLVGLVIVFRSLVAPELGGHSLYLFLVPPVLIVGIIGGWGPGLFAMLLGLVLHLYSTGEYATLLDIRAPSFAADLARALTFAALGIGIAWLGEHLRTTRQREFLNAA